MQLEEVHVQALPQERLSSLIGPARTQRFDKSAQASRDALSGRAVVNVNSTATGGGVAEMLRTLLAYTRGVGIDTRWFVVNGDPGFFAITKRIHNHLYGAAGDGGPLGASERAHYEEILRPNAAELASCVRPRDVVLLHDPQTAGLAPHLARSEPPSCGAATSVPTPRTTTWNERGPSCVPTSATSTPTCSRGRRSRLPGRTPSGCS